MNGDGNTIKESYGLTVSPSRQYLTRASASVSVLPNQINTHFLNYIFFLPIANGSWDLSPQKKSESESCSVVSNSLQPHRLNSPWKSPGQNTGAGSCSLLQGIFPNPGIEPGSPVLQVDSFPAELPGKPLKGKVAQSRLTLCDPVDYTVHGILQARILE